MAPIRMPDMRFYHKPLFNLLDTVGDSSGTKNAIGDYSTPTEFKCTPSPDEGIVIYRMIITIGDTAPLSADEYGNLAELTNGIQVVVADGSGDVVDLTNGLPITKNSDWVKQSHDLKVFAFGAGTNFINTKWTFASAGQPLFISGALGERIVVRLRDNFTGLTDHYFHVQGYRTSFGNDGMSG